MSGFEQGFSLEEVVAVIAKISRGALELAPCGPAPAVPLKTIAPIDKAGPSDIAFLANPAYLEKIPSCRAGLVVLREADRQALYGDGAPRPMLLCENPYAFFAFAMQAFVAMRESFRPGVHPRAFVDPEARVAASARIDAGAVVEARAVVGERAWIGANAVVGEGALIGEDTRLYPNSTVNHHCRVGARCILHSGSVIGADGFGFAPLGETWVKIPQVGGVTIGDDVEVGANTCVDRGALEDTVIEEGVKLDNLIQIAHNVRLGAHTIMAGSATVAGSVTMGRHVMVGGSSSINGHIALPDFFQVGPASVIVGAPKPGEKMGIGFFPPMSRKDFEKAAALLRKLPEWRIKLRELDQRLAALENSED